LAARDLLELAEDGEIFLNLPGRHTSQPNLVNLVNRFIMPGHKRTKRQREQDLLIIAEMHAAGASQGEIAERFGLTQPQICQDLKLVQKLWSEDDKKKLVIIKNRLLAEISANKKVMRQAWRDSLKPKDTVSKKQVSTPGGVMGAGDDAKQEPDKERNEASLKTEDRDGNAAFMREVREYIAMELDVHGLRKKAVEMSGSEDGPPVQLRFFEVCRPESVPRPTSGSAIEVLEREEAG
jgi:hypothetical protein